ncbi:MAG: sialidase family protein [Candidatus Dormibacteria bacterium]
MRRLVLAIAGTLLALGTGAAVAPRAVLASNPAQQTLSYANHDIHFHEAHPMTGASSAGTVQIRCTAMPQGCDRVKVNIDTTLNGTVDKQSKVTITLTPSSGATMSLAEYPPGCDPNNPAQACAPYFQGAPPWYLPNPSQGVHTMEVVCNRCTGATYDLRMVLTHEVFALPPAGSASNQFLVTTFPVVSANSRQLTGQYGEPGIAMNDNGYGIINTFGPTVWTTKDAGKTWSAPYDVIDRDTACPTGYAGDGDGAVGIDNVMYADNLCLGTLGGVNNESFTNTHGGDPGPSGANWEGPFFAGGNSDRQWYATDPKDPTTLYFSYHDFNGPNINILKSTDRGHTWVCPETGSLAVLGQTPCPATATNGHQGSSLDPHYVDTGEGNITARPFVDPTNTQRIYIPYADTKLANAIIATTPRGDDDLSFLRLARSEDGGNTWSADANSGGAPVLDATAVFPGNGAEDSTVAHQFVTAGVDRQGNLYYAFSLRIAGQTQTHIMLMTSRDHGETWSEPRLVDSGHMGSNVFPTLIAGDAGRVAIAWYGSMVNDFNDTTAAWSEMFSVTTDAFNANGAWLQTRITGAQEPMHTGDICQVGLNCTLTGGNRNLSDFQTIAIDGCGMTHPVWTNDYGPGQTVTARQVAGPSLYANNPCSPAPAAAAPVAAAPIAGPVTAAGGGSPNTSTAPPPALVGGLAAVLVSLAGVGGLVARRVRPRG